MICIRSFLLLTLFGLMLPALADEFVKETQDEQGAEIIDMRSSIPAEVEVEPFPTPFKERPLVIQLDKSDEQAGQEPAEPEPTPIHADLQIFLEGNYVKSHCEKIERCDELIRLNCDYKQEGPIYYFDNLTGKTLMTCGSACVEPDPYDPLGCKECPPKGWLECSEREAKKRRAEEEAKRKAEEEAYQKMLEQEREIEKKMLEAEKDYMRRQHELEDALKQLYEQEKQLE